MLDLFAGPGGWDVALRNLGHEALGIEWDDAACATREAAGLRTFQADVSELNPTELPEARLWNDCDGLIASPPCQAWSMAGKRGGERDKEHVIRCAHEIAAGNDTRQKHGAECEDERSMLVVEPLRFTRELRPGWVALEQVPPVLELWTLYASFLSGWGYSVWTGILSAERYGVPQTRRRAILMASLDGQVAPPEPTHQEYVPGLPAEEQHGLFGSLKPWVSMAQALGWDGVDRPAPTVTGGGGANGGPEPFARGGREAIQKIRAGHTNANGPEFDPAERPARTIAGDVAKWHYRNGNQENAARRPVDEPAPTLHFGHALNSGVEWTTEPEKAWTSERPSTAVCADPRIFPPGYRGGKGEYEALGPGEEPTRAGTDAIRVTEQEAAILQSFPPDYPFQGSRTKRFEQIGNAVPPLLAEAVLRQFVEPAEAKAAA